VFVKKSYLSSCVFIDMQSVHIRMNFSLSPPLKKILDPPMTISIKKSSRTNFFRNRKLKSGKLCSKMSAHMTICEKSDISKLIQKSFRKPHYNDLGI